MPATAALALWRREWRASLSLLLLVLLAWFFLLWAVTDMQNPLAQLMMPLQADWTAANFIAVFVMWAIMMLAMMLPAAAPMILTFANLSRQQREPGRTTAFVSAYILIWTVFSLAATALHWELQLTGLITPMMASDSVWLTAILLIVAGIVQYTPLKRVCLRHCRTPMGFLLTDWRAGIYGAWRMGLKHGLFCLGCCWALMGLLFVAGVMNLAWVGALTAAVVVEKLHPAGFKIAAVLGAVLILAGLAQLLPLMLR